MDIEQAEAKIHREKARLVSMIHDLVTAFFEESKEFLPTLAFLRENGSLSFGRGLVVTTSLIRKREPRPSTQTEVLRVVTDYYSVSQELLLSRSTKAHVVRPRQMAAYLLRTRLQLSTVKIGRLLNRDHTSIISGLRRVEVLIADDVNVAEELAELERLFGSEIVEEDPTLHAIVLTKDGLAAYPARQETDRRLFLLKDRAYDETLIWIQYGARAIEMIGELVRERAELNSELKPWRNPGS